MKKSVTVLIAGVLLLMLTVLPSVSALAQQTYLYVYTTNGKSLNFRSEPSLDATIISTIPYGTAVETLGAYNSAWTQIRYQGSYGYVMTQYLISNMPPTNPAYQPPSTGTAGLTNDIFDGFQSTFYLVTVRPNTPTGYVNMRWAPSLSAAIQGRYRANEVLTVISENATWCQVIKVVDNGVQTVGFMMKQFVTRYTPMVYTPLP